jgi:hypothetical protein
LHVRRFGGSNTTLLTPQPRPHRASDIGFFAQSAASPQKTALPSPQLGNEGAKIQMAEPIAPLIDLTRLGLAKFPGVEPYPPFERHLFTELFVECAVLQMAFEGGRADIRGGLGKYLRFAEFPMGLSLACCAGEARTRGPVSWPAFCASLKLDGCPKATALWTL